MSFASASKRSRFAYQHLAASLLSDGSERFGKVIESAVHAKPAEKDYFSDANLRILFECGVNTPANWRRGKSPPEGFTEGMSLPEGVTLPEGFPEGMTLPVGMSL